MTLRQLIGQFEDYLQVYHRASSSSPSPLFITFHPNTPLPEEEDRWCFLNFDVSSPGDDCCSLTMGDRKPDKLKNFKMLEPGKPPPTKKTRKDRNGIEFTGPVDGMEQQIWKDFPEDLFDAVIARLPIATIFRFRLVCRRWNSLLTSKNFSQQCAEVPQPQPWFYTITPENLNSGAMYDPVSKKWHHTSIPAMPTKETVLPVASAGGLVCFLDIGHRSFYVCNPITKSFKVLPPRSVKIWSRVAVGMTLNDNVISGGYKILWVGCDGEYEVYDSKRNSWTCPRSMPSSIRMPLSLNFKSQAVCIDGVLYFLCSDPDGIVCYDMMMGVWKQFVVPTPLHLSDHALAGCGGKVVLVGLLTRNAATCVCIWELQKMTLLWKEVDRMPNLMCLEFYGKHIRMTCLGNNGLLMLSLRCRQMNCLVIYDSLRREWQKVPSCVLPCGTKRLWIACGTAFYPCLTDSA